MSASGPSKTSSATTQTETQNQVGASDHSSAIANFGAGTLNIEQADPEVLKALGLGAFDLVKDVISSQASEQTKREQFQGTVWEQSMASQAGELAAITELGKTTATGGQSDFNRTILYLGVAIVLGAAAIFIWRR